MKFAIFWISSTLLDREVFELITDTGSASVMGTFESKINFSCFSTTLHKVPTTQASEGFRITYSKMRKSLTNDILSLQFWKSQAFAREFKQRENDVKSDS